jgi:hypothetical protein
MLDVPFIENRTMSIKFCFKMQELQQVFKEKKAQGAL